MKRLWLTMLLLMLTAPAWATTYWVSGALGSAGTCGNSQGSSPPANYLRTINAGLACLSAGDTLRLRTGTYAESFTWQNKTGNSWSTPITVEAHPGEQVIWSVPSGSSIALNLLNIRFTILRGLVFDGTNGTNCLDRDFGVCGSPQTPGNVYTLVPVTGSDRLFSVDCNGNGCSRDLRFENNTFRNSAYVAGGLNCETCTGVVFTGNTFHSIGRTKGNTAVYNAAPSTIFDGNVFHDIMCNGINVYSSSFSEINDIVIKNNRFERTGICWGNTANNGNDYQTPGSPRCPQNTVNSLCSAIQITQGRRAQVFNNVIVSAPGGIIAHTQARDCLIVNNTMSGNIGNQTQFSDEMAGIALTTSANNCQVRNNIAYQPGVTGPPPIANAGTNTTLSNNLCSSAATGCTIVGNPAFVNASTGDFHLQAGSPAIDAGVNTSATVPTDMAGVTRPQGVAVDIGAYEFSSGPQPGGILEAQYTFDQTTADSTGHGHTGTLVGGATYGPGIIGTHALQLTNPGDYVTVPSAAALRTQQWCVSAWINMSAVDTGGCVVAGVGEEFGVFINPSGTFVPYIHGSAGYVEPISSAPSVLTGTNRHLVGTYDGTTLQGYTDNVQTASATSSQSLPYSGTEQLRIGQYPLGGAFHCQGRIDQVYVYSGKCTPEAVAHLYNEQAPPPGLSVTHQAWYTANAAQGAQLGATDTDRSHPLTAPVGVRWAIHKSDPGSLTEYFRPYARVLSNTGAVLVDWTEITNSFGTLGVRYLQDSAISQGEATSVLLPLDGFTGIPGKILENPIDTTAPYDASQRITLSQGQHVELEIRIEFGPPLVPGQQVEIRPQRENGSPFDSYADKIFALQFPGVDVLLPQNLSPVINAVPCLSAVTTDIRGVARPQGPDCDIGAYEMPAVGLVVGRQGGTYAGGTLR